MNSRESRKASSMKTTITLLVGSLLVLAASEMALARGGGGGFRGGGGGFSGGGRSFGGGGDFRGGGGFDTGGYRGGDFNANRGSNVSGYRGTNDAFRGNDAGVSRGESFDTGARAESGNFSGARAGDFTGAREHLPTDGAFGGNLAGNWSRAGAAGAIAHATTPISGSVASARGTAVRNNFVNNGAFGRDWGVQHPGAWFAAGWGASTAWHACTWPAFVGWCGWPATVAPVYYEYGDNVTYQGDQVYYGNQPVATADQYYQQAADIAQTQPPADAGSNEWLPLGVFSLVQGDQSDTNVMFQLAVNKSGTIAGNYYSALTGTTAQVHGSVDKQTQRAAWTVGDNTTTVYDTGITNLTKDQAPVLIHIGKDKTQQWLLVRLQQNTDQQGAAQQGAGK
jgi:hypothetical protein